MTAEPRSHSGLQTGAFVALRLVYGRQLLHARRAKPSHTDCSSAWFVERFLAPKTIDAEPDALQRGIVAHSALYLFFTRVPAELGVEPCQLLGESRVAEGLLRHRHQVLALLRRRGRGAMRRVEQQQRRRGVEHPTAT